MDKPGTIAINRGNRTGLPVAVYVTAADGTFRREDYRNAADARRDAQALSRRTGWAVTEDLGRDRTPKPTPLTDSPSRSRR